jgi:beta-phosphoglucomutase-like phosphatase (HAD superfamily)
MDMLVRSSALAQRGHLVQRPDAVIFDMDGPMVDTERLAGRAWTAAADTIGVDFDCAMTARLIGRNGPDCMTLLRKRRGGRYRVPGVRSALAAGMTPMTLPDLNPPPPALLAHDLLVMPTLHAVLAYLAPLPAATHVR